MTQANEMMRELSASEVDAVAGGMDLDNYRYSTNVRIQVREGNMIVEYDYWGRCTGAWWAPL